VKTLVGDMYLRSCPLALLFLSAMISPASSQTGDAKLVQDILCNGRKIGEFHLTVKEPFMGGGGPDDLGGVWANGGFKLTDPKARDEECWCQEYEIFQVVYNSDPDSFPPARGKILFVDPLPWPDENFDHSLNWDFCPFYWNHKNNGFKDAAKTIPDTGHENQDNSGIAGKGQGPWTLYFSDCPRNFLRSSNPGVWTFLATTCVACVNEKFDKESDCKGQVGEFKIFSCMRWGFSITQTAPGVYTVTRVGPEEAKPTPPYVFTTLDQFNDKGQVGNWTVVDIKKPCPPPKEPPHNCIPRDTLPGLATAPTVEVVFDATTQALTVGPAPVAYVDDRGVEGPTPPQYAGDPVLQATVAGGIYWLYARIGSRVQFINDSNPLNLYHFNESLPPGSKSDGSGAPPGPVSAVTGFVSGRIPVLVYGQEAAPFSLYGDCQDSMFTQTPSLFMTDLKNAVQSSGEPLGYFVAPIQDIGVLTNNFTTSAATLARAYLAVPGHSAVSVAESPPHDYGLRASFPNPSAAKATIAYSLAREQEVELGVYDLSGRLVRQLVSGKRPEGDHTATWDGADRSGRPVPAGLYLYRLRTPGYTKSRPLVITR